jgi:hypothetical protein
VGVFDPNWSPLYAWNDSAATFTVDALPPPTVSVTGRVDRSHFNVGDTATFTATVSATQNSLPPSIVDFEVYKDSGEKVWGDLQDGIQVPRDGTRKVIMSWTLPSSLADGVYTFKIGVFGAPDWKPLYVWNDSAATFAVGNARVPANTLSRRLHGVLDALHSLLLRGYHFLRRVYWQRLRPLLRR